MLNDYRIFDYRITQQDAMRQTLNNTIHVIVITGKRCVNSSKFTHRCPWLAGKRTVLQSTAGGGSGGGEAHAVDYGVRIRIFSVRIRPQILI